jgi:hypothetical protein
MEQNIKKIKLNQELVKIQAEMKKLDIDKLEMQKQVRLAEHELPTLKTELEHARRDAESKKKQLEHHTPDFHHASMVKTGLIKESPIKKDDFSTMTQKATIDRELLQKERDIERKTIELNSKVSTFKRKQFDIERQYDELVAAKRDIEREFEALHHTEELMKRAEAQKSAGHPHEESKPKFSIDD